MKIRILLLAGLLVSNFSTVAEAAGLTVQDGKGTGGTNGSTSALQPGQSIPTGTTLDTPPDSTLTLKLSNGKSLKLGPGSRIRIKTMAQSDSNPELFSLELVLLRGTIAGDSTGVSVASNFTLRTTAGTVNVAGARFAVNFQPTSLTAGNLKVVSLDGNITLTPVDGAGPVSVPSGSQASAGGGANTTPLPLSGADLKTARDELAGIFPGATSPASPAIPPAPAAPSITLPDLSLIVISPNGEGTGL